MRIVVTGKNGQVALSLKAAAAAAGVEVIAVGQPELDLAQPQGVEAPLLAARPDVIVSSAAYTAVDKAESEPELAFAINEKGAGAVAAVAARLKIPVIHLSTDYVFDGGKPTPYLESDATGPLSVYGASKLAGEKAVAAATADHVILRTAWVYSPYGKNFLKTMLMLGESRSELRVVADQFGRPTSALDIADAVIAIARRLKMDAAPELRGLFNLTASGEASWADFAQEIFRIAGKAVTVERIPTTDYPTPARRPANSRLDGAKLARHHDITLPDWREATAKVIDLLKCG